MQMQKHKNVSLDEFCKKKPWYVTMKLLKGILSKYQSDTEAITIFKYEQKDNSGITISFTVNMEKLVDNLSIFDDKFWATIKYMNATARDTIVEQNNIGINHGVLKIKNIPKTKLNCPLFNVNLGQINTALNGILSIMNLPVSERFYGKSRPIAEMGLGKLNTAWATLLASYNVNVSTSLELGDIPEFAYRNKYIATFIARFNELNEWYKECPTTNIKEELKMEIDDSDLKGLGYRTRTRTWTRTWKKRTRN